MSGINFHPLINMLLKNDVLISKLLGKLGARVKGSSHWCKGAQYFMSTLSARLVPLAVSSYMF